METEAPPNTAANRAAFEREAAAAVGFMVFEWSRLEMELGLALVWKGAGEQLHGLTSSVGSEAFSDRISRLKRSVEARHAGTPVWDVYQAWLARANEFRLLRNAFLHGRWAVSPASGTVANVVGLPTSEAQKETRYTLKELNDVLDAMKTLREDFGSLVGRWPL